MDPSPEFDDWFDKQPPMSDEEKRYQMMLYLWRVIRPLTTPDLLRMRDYLKVIVDAGPEEQIGLELIDGEIALRELGLR